MRLVVFLIFVQIFFGCNTSDNQKNVETPSPTTYSNLETLQRNFVEKRFGGFIHFGIRTFTGGSWGAPNQDIAQFNPTQLDCGQWARAFKSAGMEYGIFTTKHHDGFALWDSKYTDFDVASIPWRDGKGDVIKEYVDAFRAEGLSPCLYFSIWDSTEGIGEGPVTQEQIAIVKGQLTELLTNYGKIDMLLLDGWSWKIGHKNLPYEEIHGLIKSLQPECLIVDNTHLKSLYNQELLHFEWGSGLPTNNTQPAVLSLLINEGVGNGWFWNQDVPKHELLSVDYLVDSTLVKLEPQWISFVLNCPPNQAGLMDDNIVARLAALGTKWFPNPNRKPLPVQEQQIHKPITPVSAFATSGEAEYAIDGFNDRYKYTIWETDSSFSQELTIDLGVIRDSVSIITYLPKYIPYIKPLEEGSITKFSLLTSVDGQQFNKIGTGEWSGDTKMKSITFTPRKARFVRLVGLEANDGFVAATEVGIGRGAYPYYDFE